MNALKPAPPGPWSPYRFDIMNQIHKLGLRSGDIVVRLGNARVNPRVADLMQLGSYVAEALGLKALVDGLKKAGIQEALIRIDIPFSSMIAATSSSKYSHAAMVVEGGNDPLILDVGPRGVTRQYFRDWIDDVRSDDVLFLRYRGVDYGHVMPHVASLLKEEIKRDVDYNSDFVQTTDALYCVQLPYYIFQKAGVTLGPPTRFIDLPNWNLLQDIIAVVSDINPTTPVYFVGDEKTGLLASKNLEKLGRVAVEKEKVVVERLTDTFILY